MRRVHLHEIEDSSLCPRWLRRMAMEVLREAHERIGHYDAAAPLLADLVRRDGGARIVDLCSGAAGPLPRLARRMREAGIGAKIVCTDKFPPREPARGSDARTDISFWPEPVDAREVPAGLDGTRTLFTAFHHFEPDTARSILSDARAKGASIAVFEITERSWMGLGRVAAFTAICVLSMPFVRPLSISRLFCTYCVPILPLLLLWDGIVSTLRSYSSEELLALVPTGHQGEWHSGTLPSKLWTSVTYLIGRPVSASDSDHGSPPAGDQRDDEKHEENHE